MAKTESKTEQKAPEGAEAEAKSRNEAVGQTKADANLGADQARAEAEEGRAARDAEGQGEGEGEGEARTEPTTALEAKSAAAMDDPARDMGDHLNQKFGNDPENPPKSPNVDYEVDQEKKVRLEITDSDHPDPKNPKVTYVPEMAVGDYLRAGWRRAAS